MDQLLQPQVLGLIILGICILLFLINRLSQATVGFIGCLLMVLTKVASFEDVFSQFSNDIVLLMASAMVVGIAMFNTGVAQILGKYVIRFSSGNEKIFLMSICILTGILSMFLPNTALIASFIPIIDSVCKSSTSLKRRDFVLPVALSAMFGGASTLIGTTPQLTANGLLMKLTEKELGMWDLTGPGLLIFLLFLIFLFFYGFEDGKKIWIEKKEISLCTSCDVKEQKEIYDKRKLIIMSFIVTLMIISYVFSFLPTALTAMSAAILCIIFGLCSAEDVINKLHWESIIFLGTCLGIGNALTISGAGDLAGTFLMNVLGDIKQPFAIFTIFVILTFVISQFITNSTAIIIALPIALSICEIYGFNHMTFTVGITLASSYACLTPLAASQIAMTEVAGYEFLDYFKYGWKMTILVTFGIIILVPLFYPLK